MSDTEMVLIVAAVVAVGTQIGTILAWGVIALVCWMCAMVRLFSHFVAQGPNSGASLLGQGMICLIGTMLVCALIWLIKGWLT